MKTDRFYLITLYDYYHPLLTNKQREYFQASYFQDLSLAEIADLFSVSRTAIQLAIKNIEKDLITYESKLKLYLQAQKRVEYYQNIKDHDIKQTLLSLEIIGGYKDEK